MTHYISTTADYEKAIDIYCQEHNIDKFTLEDFKSNRDVWIEHHQGIIEIRKRENLLVEINDEEDIEIQLKQLNITPCDFIKYLLSERLDLLSEIYTLQN